MTRYVILDVETDGLDPKNIWVCVTKDLTNNEIRIWYDPRGLREYLKGSIPVGHNLIWFDVVVLNRLWNLELDPEQCIDTLVVSRLINSWDYSRHGLADWGERLGFPKTDYSDWSKLTPEMVEYCTNDVLLTEKIFLFLQRFIEDDRLKRSMQTEHRAAIICRELHDNGFGFDIASSHQLYDKIKVELESLSGEIQRAFPPRKVVVRTILPRPTKDGRVNRTDFRWITDGRTPEELGVEVGKPFSIYETIEFNPSSPKQCIEKLNELGWQPTEKTKGHIKLEREYQRARGPDRLLLREKLEGYKKTGWTISEENLATLPDTAPKEAKLLTRYILLTRRLSNLDEWINAYNPETKRIHGDVHAIGTWTHRASHKNPNTGNIATVLSEFGPEMRTLWNAGVGFRQIGCDAEGIQLRILAHYMDDLEFTTALSSGSSKDGTDVHTLNMKKLGKYCDVRDTAKRFIYSWILGAGVGKTAQILKCSNPEADQARNDFLEGYPGLKYVKQEMSKEDAARGFFFGLDGRPVMCDSQHHMISGYLQNGETVVMKMANWEWRRRLLKERIPFWQMAYVHDEWQTRTIDDEDVATYVGQLQADSIKWAGEELGLKCPLAGSFKIGYNWKDCH